MKDKEIGGYFGLEMPTANKEYHAKALRFNLARSALEFILKARNIKTIYVPDYSCHVVFEACSRAGVTVCRYNVSDNLLPDIEFISSCDEWIYITNYFGQLNNKLLKQIKELHDKIIVDNVQAFFEMPIENADTIYSCRKYFGVPDGAYLYTSEDYGDIYNMLDTDCSAERYRHIIGRIDKSASDYYIESRSNEGVLDNCSVLQMSPSTKQIMSGIDYYKSIERRRNNFNVLNEGLRKYNMLNVYNEGGLFFYPLYHDDGVKLRAYLNSNKIYTPMLWPELRDQGNVNSKQLVDKIVAIPIDHRYETVDMLYIVDIVDKFIKGER